MPVCEICGSNVNDNSFCSNCGYFHSAQNKVRTPSVPDKLIKAQGVPNRYPSDKLKTVFRCDLTSYCNRQKFLIGIFALLAAAFLAAFGIYLRYNLIKGILDFNLGFLTASMVILILFGISISLLIIHVVRFVRLQRVGNDSFAVIPRTVDVPLIFVVDGRIYHVSPDTDCPVCAADALLPEDNNALHFDTASDGEVFLVCDYGNGSLTHFFSIDTIAIRDRLRAENKEDNL